MDRERILLIVICALSALIIFKVASERETKTSSPDLLDPLQQATEQLPVNQQWIYWRDRGFFGNEEYCTEITTFLSQIRSPQGLQFLPPNSWATTDFLRNSAPGKNFNLQGMFILKNDPNTGVGCAVFTKNESGYPGLYCAEGVSRNHTVLVNIMRRASEEITSCLSNDKWVFDGWRYRDFGDYHPGDVDNICKTPGNNGAFCNGRWSKPGSEPLWLYSIYNNNLFYLGVQFSVGNH